MGFMCQAIPSLGHDALMQAYYSQVHLKELLGHSQISMTERYSHLQPGTFQSAVKILEQGVATARQEELNRVKAEQDDAEQVVSYTK